METIKKAKIPLLIITILVLSFFVYNSVFKTKESDNGIKQIVENTSNRGRDFAVLLTLIKSVDFDEKFFQDPVFKSLVDFSKPVKEEDKTRDNPFAPGILSSFNDISLNIVNKQETKSIASSTSPTTATTTPTQ